MSTDRELSTRTEAEDEEEYEGDEEYSEEAEEYERWVATEQPDFRFKPLVIGLVIFGVIGVGAAVLATSLTDPADKFDSAPVLQDPSEAKTALSVTGTSDRSFAVEMPEERPRAARAVQPTTESAAVVDGPAAEAAPAVVEPAPAAEEPAPEPEVVEEPAVAEPPPQTETAGYDDLLAQAKKQRNRRQKEELLRQAIELNPQGDEALATLAMLLMERSKTRDEALGLAARAVETNPDNGLGWLVIGYVKQIVGKVAEAKEAYRKCAGCSGPKRYVVECRRLG